MVKERETLKYWRRLKQEVEGKSVAEVLQIIHREIDQHMGYHYQWIADANFKSLKEVIANDNDSRVGSPS